MSQTLDFFSPPNFTDSSAAGDIYLSATDLAILRKNCILLDGESYRREPFFDSSGADGDPVGINLHPTAYPVLGSTGYVAGRFSRGIWYGLKIAGATTLTIRGAAHNYASESLDIEINGVNVGNVTLGNPFSKTISVTGYKDNQPLKVELFAKNCTLTNSQVFIRDVSLTPITLTGPAWVAPPTNFAGVYSATKLNQISAAQTWLFNRINKIPWRPIIAHMYRNGASKVLEYILYSGNYLRTNAAGIMRIIGAYEIAPGLYSRLKVYADGVLIYTSPTYGPGPVSGSFSIPIADNITVGTSADIHLVDSTIAPSPTSTVAGCNRWTFTTLREDPLGNSFPIQSPPTLLTANSTSYTPTQLNTYLNAMSTMLINTKAVVDASESFDRYRFVRRRYGFTQQDQTKFTRVYPHVFLRVGNILQVYGTNLFLCWGRRTRLPDEGGTAVYKWENEVAITDTDQLQLKNVYLNDFPTLPGNSQYFIKGDTRYAVEYLDRVAA